MLVRQRFSQHDETGATRHSQAQGSHRCRLPAVSDLREEVQNAVLCGSPRESLAPRHEGSAEEGFVLSVRVAVCQRLAEAARSAAFQTEAGIEREDVELLLRPVRTYRQGEAVHPDAHRARPPQAEEVRTSMEEIKLKLNFTNRFKCKTCPAAFCHGSQLDFHIRSVHLNVRPYACKYCNKTFMRQYCRTIHERFGRDSWPCWLIN